MKKELRTEQKTFYYQDKTLIMGILNITPDSFSDGGSYATVEDAVQQAKALEADGADIIDVGGESTRPGHTPISEAEEIERILPVIKVLSEELKIPISVDTWKANVARKAVEAGASIINDIWGAKREPEIARVAAEFDVPIVLMHNRLDPTYTSLMDDVLSDLAESIEIALKAGVKKEQIILDPGIGFAKTYEENIRVMQDMEQLRELDYPVLLGTSRKSVVAQTLDLPVDQRDEGTGATVCFGMTKGCEIVRVHNVKLHVRMVKMMDKLLGKGVDHNG
ncbi:dihydropteroate synthase [Gracilibacillus caseinilyticus]|uniref:Dihydropteroate synthase n=1 Tax=Gracilibacillus caseinilyticus TaxID=2932256 RepID=A0ABY4EYL9_9BACI|nr:dihydropteroate synthase [Gracilibacillus caseinilyticus]UOQ49491.1 dihydropteroate synthase [Gracilibacillus caseinilyticus]